MGISCPVARWWQGRGLLSHIPPELNLALDILFLVHPNPELASLPSHPAALLSLMGWKQRFPPSPHLLVGFGACSVCSRFTKHH